MAQTYVFNFFLKIVFVSKLIQYKMNKTLECAVLFGLVRVTVLLLIIPYNSTPCCGLFLSDSLSSVLPPLAHLNFHLYYLFPVLNKQTVMWHRSHTNFSGVQYDLRLFQMGSKIRFFCS